MTPQELLLPRYKVTSKYPTSPFSIGDIIIEVNLGASNNPYYIEGDFGLPNVQSVYNPESYPQIFNRLEWYQYRQPKDFPDYVMERQDNQVYQVRITLDATPRIHITNVKNEEVHRGFPYLKPATKQDYLTYKRRFLNGDIAPTEDGFTNQYDIR